MSKRIDVSSKGPALTQSPFAKLAGIAAPTAPQAPSEGSADPKTDSNTDAKADTKADTKTNTRTDSRPAAPAKEKRARGRLILRRETKHRGGKTVVLISGFAALADHDLRRLGELEKQLKQRLGCGGSLDEEKREILIQGDRPDEITAFLRGLGYDVGGVITPPRR